MTEIRSLSHDTLSYCIPRVTPVMYDAAGAAVTWSRH
jgi:hypothetical protein